MSKIRRVFLDIWVGIYQMFDMADIGAAAGLGAMGYGIAQYSEPASFVVVGALVFWLCVRD